MNSAYYSGHRIEVDALPLDYQVSIDGRDFGVFLTPEDGIEAARRQIDLEAARATRGSRSQPLREIIIEPAEGDVSIMKPRRFTSWKAANDFLNELSRDHGPELGYLKCDVQITWDQPADKPFVFVFRYDLYRPGVINDEGLTYCDLSRRAMHCLAGARRSGYSVPYDLPLTDKGEVECTLSKEAAHA